MAKNQLYTHNDHIAITADKDYKSGDPVVIGQYAGVAQIDAKKGAKVTIWLDGSWNLDVAGAVTVGQPVYLKSDGTLTATASGSKLFGIANADKPTGTGPAEIAPYGKLAPTTGA